MLAHVETKSRFLDDAPMIADIVRDAVGKQLGVLGPIESRWSTPGGSLFVFDCVVTVP
jgi:hypothetical protein